MFYLKVKSGLGVSTAQQETSREQNDENRPPIRRRQGNCCIQVSKMAKNVRTSNLSDKKSKIFNFFFSN